MEKNEFLALFGEMLEGREVKNTETFQKLLELSHSDEKVDIMDILERFRYHTTLCLVILRNENYSFSRPHAMSIMKNCVDSHVWCLVFDNFIQRHWNTNNVEEFLNKYLRSFAKTDNLLRLKVTLEKYGYDVQKCFEGKNVNQVTRVAITETMQLTKIEEYRNKLLTILNCLLYEHHQSEQWRDKFMLNNDTVKISFDDLEQFKLFAFTQSMVAARNVSDEDFSLKNKEYLTLLDQEIPKETFSWIQEKTLRAYLINTKVKTQLESLSTIDQFIAVSRFDRVLLEIEEKRNHDPAVPGAKVLNIAPEKLLGDEDDKQDEY